MKFLIIIIFGVILIAGGFAVLQYPNELIKEKYPTTTILTTDSALMPEQVLDISINATAGSEIILLIETTPTNVPILFGLYHPNKTNIFETVFVSNLNLPLKINDTGTYKAYFGNMGSEFVVIRGLVTPEESVKDEDLLEEIARAYSIGSFLGIIGFVLVVIGIIVLIIKKVKRKTISK